MKIFIMNMTGADDTSGVDRYMEQLAKGFSTTQMLEQIIWIRFVYDQNLHEIKKDKVFNITRLSVPLPMQITSMINQPFWMERFCEVAFHLLHSEFNLEETLILHLHTLNLIDFALHVRSQHKGTCKIISHLHCIPWKGYFNSKRAVFNKMYNAYYNECAFSSPQSFIVSKHERQSYELSDCIVCVTQSASDFLHRIYNGRIDSKIRIVGNGIDDFGTLQKHQSDSGVRLLYVGNLSESKGLQYILKSLDSLQQKGLDFRLTIAGKCDAQKSRKIKKQYPNLNLEIKGLLPYNELEKLYLDSDVGVIASLQEQCSYVAIEMMMFGLPVVTTNVDGLDEMFVEHVNALKVPTRFSRVLGLGVDVERMSKQIELMITDKNLREKLGKHSRKRYENLFSSEQMMNNTIKIYNSVL